MSEVADRYDRIAAGFEQRLRGVGSDELALATPCTEWTVRELVTHVVDTHRRVVASLDATDAEPADPDGDLVGQWTAARRAVADAVGDPARAATTISGMFGEQPFESLVSRLLSADTLLHTWDLARATGQDETLDAEAVAKAAEFLAPLDERIRRPGGFGPKIEPPPGAGAQLQLLCFAGRAV